MRLLFAGTALTALVIVSGVGLATENRPTVGQQMAQTPPSASAPQGAAQPPATSPAPAQETAERAQVAGFRSARWGMTEAQVKAAIQKDFNISADKVQSEENASERTAVLSITVDELLEGAGKARVSYIFGYASKKLIQVNVVWGTAADPQVKPERVVAAANQLRALFLSSGYDPDTVVSNVPTGEGAITVFQGQDSDKHMTLLRLVSTTAPVPAKQQRKSESPSTSVALLLSYVQDARNPDVYRLKKGQF